MGVLYSAHIEIDKLYCVIKSVYCEMGKWKATEMPISACLLPARPHRKNTPPRLAGVRRSTSPTCLHSHSLRAGRLPRVVSSSDDGGIETVRSRSSALCLPCKGGTYVTCGGIPALQFSSKSPLCST